MTTVLSGVVARRQVPLQKHYCQKPQDAAIVDRATAATGDAGDPFHGQLTFAALPQVRWGFGIHRAVGGDHDAPNPGEFLSAALAACLQATTRLVADRLGIAVQGLEVEVNAHVDVRGTLLVDADVPVGFQVLRCRARLTSAPETPAESLRILMQTAEHCCVVLQTLNRGVPVETEWVLEQDLAAVAD